ncbi:MAG TPA: HlyD family efflux transporter periplasmic adaptor subunit [Steroidobacteraceae bacterium]|jgi:HlyD family secretion protein|nr:HlyD family efflux transporter periplasmic adaptor subunit [Steroidobacteraceae bacterium]
MSITNLKPPAAASATPTPIRDTSAQDITRQTSQQVWYRRKVLYIAGGAVGLALILAWLVHGWVRSGHIVSMQSLEIATVTRGDFVQDVAGRGTVIAAISPTLSSTAPGTVTYLVHAGDRVTQGEVLARLASPELENEYEREQATLASMDAALAQQRVELQQELLQNRQQTDLAAVTMSQQLRELQRLQAAWAQRLISQQNYEAAYDTYSIARLNYENANRNSILERQRILLELRTRQLARNAQSLLVQGLQHRIDALTVRSPVNGMVADLAQPDQSHVGSSMPLATVIDLSALAIQFQVAESFANGIEPGLPTDITLDGQTVHGVVTEVSPDVRDGWVTGRAKFVGGQPVGLRQNEQAAVRIVMGEHKDVLTIDRGAFLDPATRFVYVIRGDEATRTPVELGAASVSEIQVLRGLAAGDRVVISDTQEFNDARELRVAR